MSSPTTEAGRIYCPRCGEDWSEVAVVRNAAREARAVLLAELEAGVEGLDLDGHRPSDPSDEEWDGGWYSAIAAVLDLIRAQGTAKEPQSLGEP